MQADDVLSQIEEHFHVLSLGEKSLDLGKILSTDTSVRILETVYNSDPKVGVSASEISETLGVGRTTVLYHLGRMQESGLIGVNPVLKDEDDWKKFWSQYRDKNLNLSKDQFNSLHEARMNGIKLFVPTKKGFLVLPSTDADEGRSMVRDVLSSFIGPVVEGDYRRMKKTTSILGTVGALLIAISFLFQMPFFHYSEVATAPAAFGGSPATAMNELAMESSPAASPTPATPPPALAESRVAEKSAQAQSAGMTEDSVAGADLAVEEVDEPTLQSTIQPFPINKMALASKASLYAGILLLGSVLGFLLFSYTRKK